MKILSLGTKQIAQDQPCFIIAEAGVNHNGDMAIAHRLIDEALKAGADAVKFQSFITEELITPDAPKANYQVETTGQPGSQYAMLKALELTQEQQRELKAHCDQSGIIFISTPYDYQSVDWLDEMAVSAYKIASTDTSNIPFLRYIARKNRPVLLSTGMSTLTEVEDAVNALKQGGLDQNNLVILHCTSEYPAPIDEVNLRAMNTLAQAFNCVVGFSDHTSGVGASPWAVALGAVVVEKHFTLDCNMVGPDHRASLEPEQFAELVKAIRDVEAALGDGVKCPTVSELPNKPNMQKSLVARKFIAKGEFITEEDLTTKRPATGLAPKFWDTVVGRRAMHDIQPNQILTLASIDWS